MRRILCVLLFLTAMAGVQAERTTRRGLRITARAANAEMVAAGDTITGDETSDIRLSGYDKPLRSRKETFFASNEGKDTVAAFSVTVTYLDMKGCMMHRAVRRIKTAVPPGQTRSIEMPSWDRQHSFYYHRSEVPARAAQATPYDVTISVDTLFLQSKSQLK